ncbi:MAG: c-type cytochrome, partial [Anaerolineae bacterium]|nr:c-type cytochrome [Anaerolineae bacterium]
FSPTPIGTQEFARLATPARWFNQVSQGNLDTFMPPFSNSLTPQQRWDVLAYVYSLSASEELLAQGNSLYAANCAACHGEDGRGDGPQAGELGTPLIDFTDISDLADLTGEDLYLAFETPGEADVHRFDPELNEDQRWALTAYIQRMFFAAPVEEPPTVADELLPDSGDPGDASPPTDQETPPDETPPEEAAPEETAPEEAAPEDAPVVGVITGTVTNGSGGELPDDLTVSLFGVEHMNLVVEEDIAVDANGAFVFDTIEMAVNRIYLVTVTHGGVTYRSEAVFVQPEDTSLDLPITMYDSTSDTSGLVITSVQVIFEFSTPDLVRVIQLYHIANTGSSTIVPVDAQSAVFSIELPEGATDLIFEDANTQENFIFTETGFGDPRPIQPGEEGQQLFFAYSMPYTRKLGLTLPFALPVEKLFFYVPEGDLRLSGGAIQDLGPRDLGGFVFQVFGQEFSPPNMAEVSVVLSGRNPIGNSQWFGLTVDSGTWYGLGALLITLGSVAWWTNTGRSEKTSRPAAVRREDILDEILELDDAYMAGEFSEAKYRQLRAQLKAMLRNILDEAA